MASTGVADWTVRAAGEPDMPAIHRLAQTCFDDAPSSVPINYSPEHTAWQLLACPAGSFRGLLAEVEGQPIAFYAVIPMEMRIAGRLRRAALSLMTMTHPRYRGRGLFPRLASDVYRALEDDGFACVYGFPNDSSLPVLTRRLQWTHTTDWDMYVRPLRPLAILRRMGARKWAKEWGADGPPRPPTDVNTSFGRIHEIDAFDQRVDLLDTGVGDAGLEVVRDAAYLNWRYVACPDWRYRRLVLESEGRIDGYLVWRKVSLFGLSGAMIMDVAVSRNKPHAMHALVRSVVATARDDNADLVACLRGKGGSVRQLFRDGFCRVPARLAPKQWHFAVRTFDPSLRALCESPSAWRIGLGDCDVM